MTPPSEGRTRAIEIHDRMDVGNRDHQKTEHNLAILQEMAERAEAAERERDEAQRWLNHWKRLGDGVRIESEQLQAIAAELNLLKPQDRQGYEGAFTAFDIIRALQAQLTEAERAQQALRAALDAILASTREDAKGEQWTIRKYLDERGVFNSDISSSRRLVAEACQLALTGSPSDPGGEKG